MNAKKECVAMLLAGGQGSRLKALTKIVAKPAVQFGGKYRIIDFPLSNCINSGIDTVGVLTQYQPLILNEYIGSGQPWDLDRTYGGVRILPPYQGAKSSDWYKGTANAIYQNMQFINRFDPDYVLILSGDHIYSMDYSKMLEFHKKNKADCTISVISVPQEDVSRFGILSANENGRITKFEEKPKVSESTDASMGIYIFSRKVLEEYLEKDNANPQSENDFGKNIIPDMLQAGERLFAYPFHGYWKDVGTLKSLWVANMDLLSETQHGLIISNSHHRVFSRNEVRPPHYFSKDAVVNNAIISDGCRIEGTVINSVLSPGVVVEKGAVVTESVIMSDTVIKKGAVVNYSIIDSNVTIGSNAKIGLESDKRDDITLIGAGCVVKNSETIKSGSIISTDN